MHNLGRIGNALLVTLFSLMVVAICFATDHSFFLLDDAQNEYIGFMHQYGESWLSGEIPLITKNMMIGSNAMVELQRAIFSPHNIIASVIDAKIHYAIAPGLFLGFVNIFILCLSGYIIGLSIGINKNLSFLLGMFMAVSPMFLYQYAGPWWNASNGHAMSMMAVASAFYLFAKKTNFAFIFNFLSVLYLLISGWPHGFIGYLFVCTFLLLFSGNLGRSLRLSIPTILAGICAIPVYSEFIFLNDFITRPSSWSNENGFMVPSIQQMLLTFSPVHFEHMNYFGGYEPVFIAFGFTSIFSVFPLFFSKIDWSDKNLKTFIYMSIFFLILCQMPSQAGMLRYPIRFLPFFTLIINILTFYCLSKFEIVTSASREKWFFIFVSSILTIDIFTMSFEKKEYLLINIILFFLYAVVYFKLIKNDDLKYTSPVVLSIAPLFCLALMVSALPDVGGKYMYKIRIPNSIRENNNLNLTGNILSFSRGGFYFPQQLADLNSSQFGYYDIKNVNGYSPNGHKYIDKYLIHNEPQAFLKQYESLSALTKKNNFTDGRCILSLFGISSIILENNDLIEAVKSCGYSNITDGPRGMKYASDSERYDSSLTYKNIKDIHVESESNNTIVLDIPEQKQGAHLIFSREYWPGYKATGLPCKVNVGNFNNALLTADIPAGCSGRLSISYSPVTWRYTLICPILGVIGMVALLLANRRLYGKKKDD